MDFEEHLLKYLTKEEISSLMSSLKEEDKHSLLLNTSKITKEEFLKLFPNIKEHPLVKNGFYYDKSEYEFGKKYMHDAGVYYLQEPSAMIVASLLNPNEDDIVLDMCAAPGGKTTQTSLLMNNKGLIIANDLSYSRAKILSSNVERMGLANVVVTSMDLSSVPSNFNNSFTKIILDAPCSGSGMFRKDQKFKDDWTYEKVLKCVETQKQLIDIAYRLLAPNGTLIYSTCSYSYEEDEEIIEYALNNYNDLKLLPIKDSSCFYKSKSNLGIHLFPFLFNGEGHYICTLKKENNNNFHLLPTNKKSINTKQFMSIINEYNLNNLNFYLVNNSLYGLTYNLDLSNLTVLRPGLKILELNKDIIIPDYHLSHYVSSEYSISLNEEQAKKYIHGDTFNYDTSIKGFQIVSFNNINLGFVKVTNGTLKNHYPKGLRH